MNTVERIKALCKERKIAISRLEKDCGFANGYISGLRKGTLPDDRLRIVAKYLDVTPTFLSTGEEGQDPGIDFNIERITKAIEKSVRQEIVRKYHDQEDVYYLDPRTAEIAQAIANSKELGGLFDAARNASPEDLLTVQTMLEALKRKG